mmetsp:Transcript_282/g.517  ORF Transcript_282/g.517 Transcript_282/m.517 type:complete len:325 (-) Transcript_282:374-1348(-)|eukprot:CAMPEP_0185846616 /NCGR_PEP_ID=MMETSP1354-20130828/2191_1 /TAXON_ID=708628 /ORGANISM="Erythrolobus madagascarensis, Strain CCMP3276" /LENGTH=324 /DNA_ID=CAMNT_0028546775 /DNA_START=173 /DNA_END=1147 /DNA_ORIENTATION=+
MSPLGAGVHKKRAATVFPSHVRRTFTRHPVDYTGELVRLMDDIATLTHGIAVYVAESDEKMTYGEVGQTPISSSFVTRKLYRQLCNDGYACLILSKDSETPLTFPEHVPHGGYVVCVSPLDSDPSIAHPTMVGMSFSIYKRRSSASLPGRLLDLQQNLGDQVAALICMFSSAFTLQYTMGYGVHAFTLHPVAVQYFLQSSAPVMLDPVPTCVYGNREYLRGDSKIARAVNEQSIKYDWKTINTNSLLANFALFMQNGGVLLWENAHLLCEAAPLAFLVEQAGGAAVDHEGKRILDMKSSDNPHATLTLCCGSIDSINEIRAALA